MQDALELASFLPPSPDTAKLNNQHSGMAVTSFSCTVAVVLVRQEVEKQMRAEDIPF